MENTQSLSIEKGERSQFMSKVFTYFGFALLISACGVFIGPQILPLNGLTIGLCFLGELVLIFTARMWSQKRPMNIILFGLFAFLSGLTLYPILALATLQGGVVLVYKAFFATFLMFVAAGMYGYVTQRDLSSLGGILMMTLIGLIVVGILQIFWYSNTVELIASGIGIVLFAIYTAYDIQRIKNMPDMLAIEAAIMLYLDIFNMFTSVLRFMMAMAGERE